MKNSITIGFSHKTPNKPEVIDIGGDYNSHTEKVKPLVGKPNEAWAKIQVCRLESVREFHFAAPVKKQPNTITK